MSHITDWTLTGAEGQTIYGTAHVPEGTPEGVLIVCHGFKGYKDYGLLPQLAAAAARRGLVAHRFNFSHSGMTSDVETFGRPDLFEHDTWGKQLSDLRQVTQAAAQGALPGPGGHLPQVWFGHSRGGVTALLAAAEAFDGGETEIRPAGVITAAAPHTTDRLGDEEKRLLRKLGRLESPSSRTGQTLYVGRDWLDELDAHPQRFNLMRRIEHVRCPILLIHGDDDGTVNQMSANLLRTASHGKAVMRIIENATHTFNAPNPLPLSAEAPMQTREMIEAAAGFARQCVEAS